MANEVLRNVRLGMFVLIGTLLLIAALYLIGNKQNIFGNTFQINATFYNVNGLMAGNNVRFAGIDVGTVKKVEITNDTTVNVLMLVEKRVQSFIKKNALASVGTDGLMGNRLVNINSSTEPAESVEEGDVLQTRRPIEQDEMMRTLNSTNENMKAISSNLRTITDRITSKNTLWSLLMDTVVADNVKAAIVSIKVASNSTAVLTGNFKNMSEDIRKGKGSLGALITDTTLSGKINQIIVKFERVSDSAATITGDFSKISGRLEQGQGSVGVLLKDTSFIHNLNTSINNINKGTLILNEDLEALRHSWPFKKYFKKKEKEKSKGKGK
jgi:phospholipid/cholesterol/gamma-HCH transport system substrate-binding protein